MYVQLANHEAFLALVEDDAFLIWSRYPGDDRRGLLHIWICEGRGLVKHEKTVRLELEEMARSMKCKNMRLVGREGWGRDGYWKPMGYVYEHEVK